MGFFDGAAGGIIGGGIGAIGSLISGNQQYKRQLRMMREQNAFTKSEREAAQQWQLDMWNAENSYNDPTQQRARLESAGINPYLSDLSSGNAQSVGTASYQGASGTPSAPNVDFSSPLQRGVEIAVQQYQQNKQIDSQVALNNADINLKGIEGLQLDAYKDYIRTQDKRMKDLLPYEIDNLYEQASKFSSDRAKNDSDIQMNIVRSLGERLKNILSSKEIEKWDENFAASIMNTWADSALKAAQSGMSGQMAKYYFSLTVGQNIQNKVSEKDYELMMKTWENDVATAVSLSNIAASQAATDWDMWKRFGFKNSLSQNKSSYNRIKFDELVSGKYNGNDFNKIQGSYYDWLKGGQPFNQISGTAQNALQFFMMRKLLGKGGKPVLDRK